MQLNESSARNAKALKYLSDKKKSPIPIDPPDSVKNPYYEQGSHPDVVERVWDQIGKALPMDCRCLVYGSPALVHPESGILLAFANGTTYCLQLVASVMEEAIQAGVRTYTKWSSSRDMDTRRDLGPDWIFGGWHATEIRWCQIVYKELGNPGI
jgi:hypothetical protein